MQQFTYNMQMEWRGCCLGGKAGHRLFRSLVVRSLAAPVFFGRDLEPGVQDWTVNVFLENTYMK